MSSSTLSWYSINNTGEVLTFSGEKFQVLGNVDITGGYFINGERVLAATESSLTTFGETIPVGGFINYPWPSEPTDPKIPFGFLKCNGAEISELIYDELYKVIGNKYGTPTLPYHFLLPNFSNLIIKYRFTGTPSSSDLLPIGSIFTIPWAIDPYPPGYIKCDGSLVSRIDYQVLYEVIGDIYGAGDGSTTFQLPNLFNHGIKFRSTITNISGDASQVRWFANGSFLFYEDRVGIGTVSPRKQLDVVGDVIFTGGNLGVGTDNPAVSLDLRTTSGIGPELRLSETTESYSRIAFYGTTGETYFHVSSITSHTEATDNACRLDFNIGSSARNVLSLTGQGHVGIGTTTPLTPLHLNGKMFLNDTTGITNGQYSSVVFRNLNNNVSLFQLQGYSGSFIDFTSTGNIGIGTTNPVAAVEIHGKELPVRIKTGAFARESPSIQVVDYLERPTITVNNSGKVTVFPEPETGDTLNIAVDTYGAIRCSALILEGSSFNGVKNDLVITGPNVSLFGDGGYAMYMTTFGDTRDYGRELYYSTVRAGRYFDNSGNSSSWSDRRMKENVEGVGEDVVDNFISKISLYKFDFKDKGVSKTKQYGFMAQEVSEYLPDAVLTKDYTTRVGSKCNVSSSDKLIILPETFVYEHQEKIAIQVKGKGLVSLAIDKEKSTGNYFYYLGDLPEDAEEDGQVVVDNVSMEALSLNYNAMFAVGVQGIKHVTERFLAYKVESEQRIHSLEANVESLRTENATLSNRIIALENLLKDKGII